LVYTNIQAAVARASAVAKAAARTANPAKEYPTKVRGNKKAASASKAEKKEEDVIELD
jgi:ribosomal protein L12E/L44/L45/RPP1/RPP2